MKLPWIEAIGGFAKQVLIEHIELSVQLCFFVFDFFFFFNDTATTEIYTLSLHDALPIALPCANAEVTSTCSWLTSCGPLQRMGDRKSTRLNSSHVEISYAVFCLKKK